MSHIPLSSLLGFLPSANMNSTADQAIPIALPQGFTTYILRRIVVYGASVSLSLAVGGVYNAASKPGGGILVPAAQAYSGLTTSLLSLDLTLAALALNTPQSAANIYLSLTTGQGSAATAKVALFGEILP